MEITQNAITNASIFWKELARGTPESHEQHPCEKQIVTDLLKAFLKQTKKYQEDICIRGKRTNHKLYFLAFLFVFFFFEAATCMTLVQVWLNVQSTVC